MNYKQSPFVALLIMIIMLAVIYGAFFLNRYFNTTTNVLNIDGTRDLSSIAVSSLWSLLALVGVLLVFSIISALVLKNTNYMPQLAKSCKAIIQPLPIEIPEIPELRVL